MIHSKEAFLTETVQEFKIDSLWCKLWYVEAVAHKYSV